MASAFCFSLYPKNRIVTIQINNLSIDVESQIRYVLIFL